MALDEEEIRGSMIVGSMIESKKSMVERKRSLIEMNQSPDANGAIPKIDTNWVNNLKIEEFDDFDSD